jgi:hypothetical protein
MVDDAPPSGSYHRVDRPRSGPAPGKGTYSGLPMSVIVRSNRPTSNAAAPSPAKGGRR